MEMATISTNSYDLVQQGTKKVIFNEGEIQVEVNYTGAIAKIFPVFNSDDDAISIDNGHIHIETPVGSLVFISSEKDEITLKSFETDLGKKEYEVIEISGRDRLIYQFILEYHMVISSKL